MWAVNEKVKKRRESKRGAFVMQLSDDKRPEENDKGATRGPFSCCEAYDATTHNARIDRTSAFQAACTARCFCFRVTSVITPQWLLADRQMLFFQFPSESQKFGTDSRRGRNTAVGKTNFLAQVTSNQMEWMD